MPSNRLIYPNISQPDPQYGKIGERRNQLYVHQRGDWQAKLGFQGNGSCYPGEQESSEILHIAFGFPNK